MAGTISSLGIGSGVLTADVIDQLKENDTALLITPIDNKITLNEQKTQALDLLNTLMSTFRSGVRSLDDDGLYQQRTVSGTTDSVSVTADAGVAVQSFSIADTQLAQSNVLESGAFLSTSAYVATGSGTMTIDVGGLSYDIEYDATMTLDALKEKINEVAGEKVTASTLQVGEEDYRLVLKSDATGADQAITISDSGGGLASQLLAYDETTNPDGIQEIQAARDASFKYNGITITRSSNKIDDLIVGVTINLLQESGSANIAISQDFDVIAEELTNLVDSYNNMVQQLDSMTLADVEEGVVGIFNGDNTINSISREISRVLTSISSDGYALPQFGIDLNEDGTMTFDDTVFREKMEEDPAAAELFFSGGTVVDSLGNDEEVTGVFTNLSELMDRYAGYSGLMDTLTTAAKEENTKLQEERTRALELLNARYDIMAARFIEYDTIINRLNNQYSVLQQQIAYDTATDS